MTIVSNMSEFLRRVGSCPDAVYRGQANAEWRVDCSAARRLAPDATGEDLGNVAHSLVAYTQILLTGSRRHVGNCSELPPGSSEIEVLAQLQHQGAATGLIDFTTESLVALWFACSKHADKDGAVYILPRSEVHHLGEHEVRGHRALNYFRAGQSDNPLYLWSPHRLTGRPASQGSVFVFGAPFLWPRQLWKVVVAKDSKPDLLEVLRAAHSIAEDTLFPDLAGYAQANSVSRPFGSDLITRFWEEQVAALSADPPSRQAPAYVGWGIAFGEAGELEQAIEKFTKAISVDPGNISGYVNRALAKSRMDDYEGAVTDFDAAIQSLGESGEGTEQRQQLLAHLYWGKGVARLRLGHQDQAYTDLNKSVELGTKMWAVETATGRVGLSPYPKGYLEYRS